MQWNTDSRQDSHAQGQPDSYDGYVGLSQQLPHTHEYQRDEQRNTFQQQEYQHGFERASYVQQQQVEPALSLNYTSLAAILCYSIGWLTGLLFLLFVRENRFLVGPVCMLFYGLRLEVPADFLKRRSMLDATVALVVTLPAPERERASGRTFSPVTCLRRGPDASAG